MKKFQKEHGKQFKNQKEEDDRFAKFKVNDAKFKKHNELFNQGKVHFFMGHNKYSDMSE